MAKTYKWKINALDVKISQDNNDNVIHTIHWGLNATEGTDPVYVANSIGSQSLIYDADNFTEYDSITEEDVIGWLESSLDVDNMKAALDSNIELQKTPVDNTFHNPFPEEQPSELEIK